jgi:hypothetical protein
MKAASKYRPLIICFSAVISLGTNCWAQGTATRKKPEVGGDLWKAAVAAAGAKCDKAFGADAVTALPQSPVLTLYQEERSENDRSPWIRKVDLAIAGLEARSPSKVETLVCLRASREKVGEYRSETYFPMGSAFRVRWKIRLVRSSDGAVVGTEVTLNGSDPPERHAGTYDSVGKTPARDYAKWLHSRMFPALLAVTGLRVQLPWSSQWTVSHLEDKDQLENAAGVIATVSILPNNYGRPICAEYIRQTAATNGGKLRGLYYYSSHWHQNMLEAGNRTMVCGDFPGKNAVVLFGPPEKAEKDYQNVRKFLIEIEAAIVRQLNDRK